jgi:hypothetical protein
VQGKVFYVGIYLSPLKTLYGLSVPFYGVLRGAGDCSFPPILHQSVMLARLKLNAGG